MPDYIHETEFEVRDYECDIQGIVNNAVYQQYLEHARHKFLLAAGLNFYELHEQNIDPVVYRAEIDYKYPLKSGDSFVCKLNYKQKGHVRIIFYQDIYRKTDGKLILKAEITAVVLKNGKPVLPVIFTDAFKKYEKTADIK
ncbi:MAG: acyl-CoA thioesterase [Chlorobi bacterium]|nr:acyl-CoA thioesterase [Chlorobiota bacterium]